MLSFMEQNADVWMGWTYWAAGSWWPSTYPFTVQPGKDGSTKAQMPVLAKHCGRGHPVIPGQGRANRARPT